MTVAGRLAERVLVGDGGMGSLLSLELPELRFPEEANLSVPEAVLAAHVGFIRAGADVIQTNTYGANPVKLGAHRCEHQVDEINAAGAKIARDAREVAGRDVLIAGSIGPLGTSVEVVGGTSSSGAGLYGRQAAVLEGRGVDLIVLETFTSLEELTVAMDAVRAQTHLPVIAQLTVQDDGEPSPAPEARRQPGCWAIWARPPSGSTAAWDRSRRWPACARCAARQRRR